MAADLDRLLLGAGQLPAEIVARCGMCPPEMPAEHQSLVSFREDLLPLGGRIRDLP